MPTCPYCNSQSVQGHAQGYSGRKGLVGGILFGLPGLLLGAWDASDVSVTCLDCGHSWKAGTAEKVRQQVLDAAAKAERKRLQAEREDRVMRKLVRWGIGVFALIVLVMYAVFVRY